MRARTAGCRSLPRILRLTPCWGGAHTKRSRRRLKAANDGGVRIQLANLRSCFELARPKRDKVRLGTLTTYKHPGRLRTARTCFVGALAPNESQSWLGASRALRMVIFDRLAPRSGLVRPPVEVGAASGSHSPTPRSCRSCRSCRAATDRARRGGWRGERRKEGKGSGLMPAPECSRFDALPSPGSADPARCRGTRARAGARPPLSCRSRGRDRARGRPDCSTRE